MSDVLSKETLERWHADISRSRHNAPTLANTFDQVVASHEALRAELARLQGQTCATCRHLRDHNWNRFIYGRCDKIGLVLTLPPGEMGCNQWAARDTATPEGGKQ